MEYDPPPPDHAVEEPPPGPPIITSQPVIRSMDPMLMSTMSSCESSWSSPPDPDPAPSPGSSHRVTDVSTDSSRRSTRSVAAGFVITRVQHRSRAGAPHVPEPDDEVEPEPEE